MLGREPRLPHGVLRGLIITLLLLNGIQLVLLQGAINSSQLGQAALTWTYVAGSAVISLAVAGLIAGAFVYSRRAGRPPGGKQWNRE